MPNTTAITTTSFINSLGVNTHVDFNSGGYQNIAQTEQAINYLGLKNLRDSAEDPAEGQAGSKWAQISAATGAKFDDYMGEGSPGQMQSDLNEAQQIAQNNPGILNYLEGGNEEDDPYATSNGNNLQITAQFQQQVYSVAHSLGLPAINMSFGQGWTAANNWHGDYDKVGDLSSVTDYANAHTYANPGQTPDSALQQLNGDALIAAGSRPIITTEVGWDENQGFSQADIAKYVLDASLDGIKDGDVKTYFYALYDDMAGRFGLMNQDGTPKPAGTALHNLTTLLNDPGANAASFTPGSLNYSLSNTQSGDNALLMEKSDGTFWLSLWNESAGAHSVTLNLGSAASQINVFDPLTGTSAVQTASNTNSVTLTIPDHPVIVEITEGAVQTSSGGSTGSGTTTGGGTVVGMGGGSASGGTTGVGSTGGGTTTGGSTGSGNGGSTTGGSGNASTPDPIVTVPGTQKVASGSTIAINGASISDPWGANAPGLMALNVSSTNGTVSLKDANGNPFPGSGSTWVQVKAPLAQINAALATLSYTASGTSGSVTVDIWDQAGVEATKSFNVNVSSSAGGSTGSSGGGTNSGVTTPPGTGSSGGNNGGGTGPTGSTGPAINIAANDANPVVMASNTTIGASAGDHMIFIGGTGDTLTATGGTESVMAFQGGNKITTGAGNDTIRFAGTNSVINAGGGNNMLADSGNNNTIVLPGANKGYDDVYGWVMTNGDTFDLRGLLASTKWNGSTSAIKQYVSVDSSSGSAVINVTPSGTPGGATYKVATFEASGPVSLTTLLSHSIV